MPTRKELIKDLESLKVTFDKSMPKRDMEFLLEDEKNRIKENPVVNDDPVPVSEVEESGNLSESPQPKEYMTIGWVTKDGVAIEPGEPITLTEAEAKRLLGLGGVKR